MRVDDVFAGTQPQVVRVSENDARAGRRDFVHRERLHRALRSDRHERRKSTSPCGVASTLRRARDPCIIHGIQTPPFGSHSRARGASRRRTKRNDIFLHRSFVRGEHAPGSAERAHEREERRARKMKIREEHVDRAKT